MKFSTAMKYFALIGTSATTLAQSLRGLVEDRGLTELQEEAPSVLPTLINSLFEGIYTVKQESTNNFMEEAIDGNVFASSTRQNNGSQDWEFLRLGTAYRIQNAEDRRYLRAGSFGNVKTGRFSTDGVDQVYVIFCNSDGYRIKDFQSGRSLEADGRFNARVDNSLEGDLNQKWLIDSVAGDESKFTIRHRTTNRLLASSNTMNNVFTSEQDIGDRSHWFITPVAEFYNIRNNVSKHFLHPVKQNDSNIRADKRETSSNHGWVIFPKPGHNIHSMLNFQTRRFADAFESSNGNSVVTRTTQENGSQNWVIEKIN